VGFKKRRSGLHERLGVVRNYLDLFWLPLSVP
jgi:hypothetical protein